MPQSKDSCELLFEKGMSPKACTGNIFRSATCPELFAVLTVCLELKLCARLGVSGECVCVLLCLRVSNLVSIRTLLSPANYLVIVLGTILVSCTLVEFKGLLGITD